MKQQHLLPLALLLLSSSAAFAEALTPEVEIDRSVLQDLRGYEPPPMFGGAVQSRAVKAPLKRVVVAPPAAPTLTVPKADALLDFPVQNNSVITRQRLTGPAEEHVASARPDYSDSHTLLDMSPEAGPLTPELPEEKPAPVKKKASVKPPLPPKKPSIQLASVKSGEVATAPTTTDFPLQKTKTAPEKPAAVKEVAKPVEKPAEKVTIAAEPMKPAEPKPKYVPTARPTMPAVPSESVESAKLDAFALPLHEADKELIAEKPTPGERMIDQALTDKMAVVDKKDIEAVMEGGKVAAGKKDEPIVIASLPSEKTATATSKVAFISMEFKPKLTDLKDDQQNTLQSEILSRLKKNKNERLQIQAFSGENTSDSDARRISLARALSVRAYLLDKGIDPSRMDVRAMGNNTQEQPLDRVDLIFIGSK